MAQNRDWFIGLAKKIVTFGMERRKFLAQFFWL
jgi:hypothetical protein